MRLDQHFDMSLVSSVVVVVSPCPASTQSCMGSSNSRGPVGLFLWGIRIREAAARRLLRSLLVNAPLEGTVSNSKRYLCTGDTRGHLNLIMILALVLSCMDMRPLLSLQGPVMPGFFDEPSLRIPQYWSWDDRSRLQQRALPYVVEETFLDTGIGSPDHGVVATP